MSAPTTPANQAANTAAKKPEATKAPKAPTYYTHSTNAVGNFFRSLFDTPSEGAILSGSYFEHLLMRPDSRYKALDNFLMEVSDFTGERRKTLIKNMGEVLKDPGKVRLLGIARVAMRFDEDNRRAVQDEVINAALEAAGVTEGLNTSRSLNISKEVVASKNTDELSISKKSFVAQVTQQAAASNVVAMKK